MKKLEDEYGELEGEIKHRTDGAVLFWDGVKKGWIPNSVIEDEDEQADGSVELLVKRWFLEENEWV